MANLQVGVAGNGTVTVGAGASVHSPASNTLTLGTNGDERIRITSGGKLLLGTNTETNNIRLGNKLGIVGTAAYTGMSISQYAGTTAGEKPMIDFNRSRGTSDGSLTSVADDDGLGEIIFRGSDGTDFNDGAAIRAWVDGTPSDDATDMPSRLTFHTSADGDTDLHERLRIDSSGRVLIGATSARLMKGSNQYQALLVEGLAAASSARISLIRNSNDDSYPEFLFGKSRGTSDGSNTIVQDGDGIGALTFLGADGDDMNSRAASIECYVDGTPGNADMPANLRFSTTADGSAAPTERMRITSGGQVLMGGTSAYNVFENGSTAPRLQVRGTDLNGSCQAWIRATGDAGAPKLFLANTRSTAQGGHTIVQNGDELGGIFFAGSDGTQFVNGASILSYVDNTPGADDMPGTLRFAVTADGGSSPTEAMRINHNRRVHVTNGSTTAYNGMLTSYAVAGQPYPMAAVCGNTNQGAIGIYYSTTLVGSITISGGNSTAFNTSSDYRLKENVVSISDGITKLKLLKPKRFNWISDSTNTLIDGFLAHEVTPAVPQAVTGTKDKVADATDVSNHDAEAVGDAIHQQLDYSKIVPLLTAALQEAVTKIETLETKVAALESA